ncbi:MAG: acetylglutamate kinase [Oscillospiraceae bacterium]
MNRACECEGREIFSKMRLLWSQHVYRTRFFIISTAECLDDLKCVTERLMENPCDFAEALRMFCSGEEADKFCKLMTEHLQIAGELVNADMEKDICKADKLRKKWYKNADEIAEFLCCLDPCHNEQQWRMMMRNHLRMTEREASLRLAKEYSNDTKMFDSVEKGALEMADCMAEGLFQRFCCK